VLEIENKIPVPVKFVTDQILVTVSNALKSLRSSKSLESSIPPHRNRFEPDLCKED
jgi:hypothetical protein